MRAKPKHKPKYRIVHGRMEWTGSTRAAVNAARDQTLDKLFNDYRTTTLIPMPIPMPLLDGETTPGVCPGVCMVYQEHDGGWTYAFYRLHNNGGVLPPNVQNMLGGPSCHAPGATRKETEDMARRHLAQMAYRDPEHNGSEYITPFDSKGREDHARWCEFQRQYAEARASGASDTEAHAKACGRPIKENVK